MKFKKIRNFRCVRSIGGRVEPV